MGLGYVSGVKPTYRRGIFVKIKGDSMAEHQCVNHVRLLGADFDGLRRQASGLMNMIIRSWITQEYNL